MLELSSESANLCTTLTSNQISRKSHPPFKRCICVLGYFSRSSSSSTQPDVNGHPASRAANPAVSYATKAATRPLTSPNAQPNVSIAAEKVLRVIGSSLRRRPNPTTNFASSAMIHAGANSALGVTTTIPRQLQPADISLPRRQSCPPRG